MSDDSDDQTPGATDEERIDYLVEQAMELSKMALDSGFPEASALLTLAVSGLRKKVA